MKCIDVVPIKATVFYYHNEAMDYEIEDSLDLNRT